MRAIQRTTFFRLVLLYSLVGALSSIAACADSLHLDPPSVLPRADSGGCTSNLECAYPSALCDTVAQVCVECIVASDCSGKPGNVCSNETCVCPYCPDADASNCVPSCGTGGGGTGSASTSSGSTGGGDAGGDEQPGDGGDGG